MAVSCQALTLARQPYDRWLNTPITNAELTGACSANAPFCAHREDPEFGYRLLADEAALEHGEAIADRTAWRTASINGWGVRVREEEDTRKGD